MEKIVASGIVALALVGCATNTPVDFRMTTPVLSLQSANEPKKVAMCIADGWESIMNGFTMRPTAEGYTITFISDGLIHFMADIATGNNGASISTTKYWTGTFAIWQSRNERFGAVVKGCQI